jgi:hypothetical protein
MSCLKSDPDNMITQRRQHIQVNGRSMEKIINSILVIRLSMLNYSFACHGLAITDEYHDPSWNMVVNLG